MKRHIEAHEELHIAPDGARESLREIVADIAAGTASADLLAFAIELRDLHLPLPGTLSVRISLVTNAEKASVSHPYVVVIEAADRPRFFPKLRGFAEINPLGESDSDLWVRGAYEPPLGAIGAGIDATLMHGVAQTCVGRFVTRLAKEIVARFAADQERIVHDVTMRAHGV